MTFPPEFVAEVRGRISITALVGETVELARVGDSARGPCPLHPDRDRSL